MYESDQKVEPPDQKWWSPAVLTASNPDNSSPSISLEDAHKVFRALEDRGLIVPCLVPVTSNGTPQTISALIVNRREQTEWKKLISKQGFFSMGASPTVYYLFGSKRPWIWLIVTFFLAAFFGEFFKKLASDLYDLSKDALIGLFRSK